MSKESVSADGRYCPVNSPWKYQPWCERSFIAQQNKRENDPIVNLNSKIGRLRAEDPQHIALFHVHVVPARYH